MNILKVLLNSFGSVVTLFILTKLMGKRQMSQLSMFDYIIGITIGSIAAEMATSLEGEFYTPLIAMSVYALTALFISFITTKSIKLRRVITGKATILYNNGKIYTKNLKHAKIDINEFLCQCRTSGYFNLANIKIAILEENGKISFLPLTVMRPVTPSDLNLQIAEESQCIDVIIDGKVMDGNLKSTGKNIEWLQKHLKEQGYKKIKDVFLATCDNQNNLTVYPYDNITVTRDMFL